MCGNPNKVNSIQTTHRNEVSVSLAKHDFNNFSNLSQVFSKKVTLH